MDCERVDVCSVDDVAPDRPRTFTTEQGNRISIFRVKDTLYAIDDSCPHAGASLALGYTDGECVACRIHHWRFSLVTGQCVSEPRPDCRVRTYVVSICDNRILIDVPSSDSTKD